MNENLVVILILVFTIVIKNHPATTTNGPRSKKTTVGEVMDKLRPFVNRHYRCAVPVEVMNTNKCDGVELDLWDGEE